MSAATHPVEVSFPMSYGPEKDGLQVGSRAEKRPYANSIRLTVDEALLYMKFVRKIASSAVEQAQAAIDFVALLQTQRCPHCRRIG